MPLREISGTGVHYYLIVFDEFGIERREPDGSTLSQMVVQQAADTTAPVTDIFIISHGWLGDVPAAISQYDAWITSMAALQSDRSAAERACPGFRALTIGFHWPSLPWGDEAIPADGAMLLAAAEEGQPSIEAQIAAYAARIADTPAARSAIRTILTDARRAPNATALSAAMVDAYQVLFTESGLRSAGATGAPGADQDGFDPGAIVTQARSSGPATAPIAAPGLLGRGIAETIHDALLAPLRQISFWRMKDRARMIGETAGHALLSRLQFTAPAARIHLMGHSFGSILVSATVAGGAAAARLPRPIDSLFLVQGALSLWSFARDIPFAPGTPGYFNGIVQNGLVRGPIITTRSTFDTAVGRFYPLGAQFKKQLLLGDDYPAYGGVGAFGIRGLRDLTDIPLRPASYEYNFRGGRVYNLEASAIIKRGGGPAGAHSDIAHAEVAHAFWSAVTAGRFGAPPPPVGGGPGPDTTSTPTATLGPSGLRSLGTKLLGAIPTVRSSAPSSSSIPETRDAPAELDARTSAAGSVSSPPSPDAVDMRWVNAEIDGHPKDVALTKGAWYKLNFDVAVAPRLPALAAAAFDAKALFVDGAAEIELTVQLDSDAQNTGADFEISESTRALRFSRDGTIASKATFFIKPEHDGPSTLKATIHKDGNFITQMDVTFDVGATGTTSPHLVSRGRPASAAGMVRPRDIGISLTPAVGGYDCVVWGGVVKRAHLPIDAAFFAKVVDTAREALMRVVMQQDEAGNAIFQTGIDIPQADNEIALRTLALAGARLFQQLFYAPGAGADLTAVGEFLLKRSADPATRLKLQIVAERAPVPWGLLYLGDVSADAALDWNNFLGMRHVFEHIPLQNAGPLPDWTIPSDNPELSVSVNVNTGIDEQYAIDAVAQQNAFWRGASASRPRVHVTSRTKIGEVLRALGSVTTDDQILYFYCHAQSSGLADPGGPDASSLRLSDGTITLAELNLFAPVSKQLAGNPLVFINACESAQMSAAFYDGFMPYFMAKGARGIVGSECQTPALFATEWANRFFERFLDGEPLGEAFLGLRREFLEQHRNPLGLCYAVYCDGDTQIQPALARTP